MYRAQRRDASSSEQFFFRKSLVPEDEEEGGMSHPNTQQVKSHDHEYTLMSVDTIINGKVNNHTVYTAVCVFMRERESIR